MRIPAKTSPANLAAQISQDTDMAAARQIRTELKSSRVPEFDDAATRLISRGKASPAIARDLFPSNLEIMIDTIFKNLDQMLTIENPETTVRELALAEHEEDPNLSAEENSDNQGAVEFANALILSSPSGDNGTDNLFCHLASAVYGHVVQGLNKIKSGEKLIERDLERKTILLGHLYSFVSKYLMDFVSDQAKAKYVLKP